MIQIRPYRIDDVEPLFAAVEESRAALSPWMPWCHDGYSIEETRGWVESQIAEFAAGTAFSFPILGDDGQLLGTCGLNRVEAANHCANLGYWVRTSAARRGVASAAVRQLVAWAFAHTYLERLEVIAAIENEASQRTAEKAGAQREGVLRRRLVLQDRTHDGVVYSFVKMDGRGGHGNSNQEARMTK